MPGALCSASVYAAKAQLNGSLPKPPVQSNVGEQYPQSRYMAHRANLVLIANRSVILVANVGAVGTELAYTRKVPQAGALDPEPVAGGAGAVPRVG